MLQQTYRGLTLDPFQQEAVAYIDQNKSVLVAAPTGVGKTLVADYVIEKIYKSGGRVVYTAPIKALSNQKFKEFKAHVGEEAVGILTGDVVINPEAPILIMTTEIFRNMLQEDVSRVHDVRYVIFDEIHYIDDPERGSVWEESLIFMPDFMRFLGLSATIPNVDQLAGWIESVQGQDVAVVKHFERAVPLKHSLFERSLGFTTIGRIKKKYAGVLSLPRHIQRTSEAITPTTHLDLIEKIKDGYLPCLFFTFSRRKCEANALELGDNYNFLDEQQSQQVREIIDQVTDRYPAIKSERWPALRRLLMKGIAYHHAGMLPVLKDIVEELFTKRLIQVLYCTETFAVGLNFPCRTVCFDYSTKWDGVSFRPISNREYFQMAGRAGRRGIDEIGYVFTIADLTYFDPTQFPSMKENEIEPLKSQFSLTYNSVLNLIKSYDQETIYRILGQNFATYQAYAERDAVQIQMEMVLEELARFGPPVFDELLRKKLAVENRLARERNGKLKRRLKSQLRSITQRFDKIARDFCQGKDPKTCRRERRIFERLLQRYERLIEREQGLDPRNRYIQEFTDKRDLLAALGYIEGDQLTAAGNLASEIHGHELLVVEMFMEGLFHAYTPAELNAVCVSIGYEPRKNETRIKHKIDTGPVQRIFHFLTRMEERFLGYSTVAFNDHIAALAYRWTNGESFATILQDSIIDEGDLVFGFRRGIDLLRQVRNAVLDDDPILSAKIKECIAKMDRDEVSIWL
jgi:superfamily II RNA helicase